jgi:3-oxoadipate enol-lactonase
VSTQAIHLEHRVTGPEGAPVLVFLNSLGTNMTMWDEQVADLSRDHRVITYDARGQGGSDVPAAPYSIERLGRDALRLLDRLGIASASLCGLSMGGQTAMWMAANHPERVDRAILANTGATIGTDELWNDRVARVRSGGMDAVVETVVNRFFTPSFRVSRRDVEDRFRDMVAAAPPEGYIGACLAIRDADLRDLVPRIDVPALVIGAQQDVATPPTEAEWLHEHIVDSKLVVLEEAAHLSPVEQPEPFNAVVKDFLAEGPR